MNTPNGPAGRRGRPAGPLGVCAGRAGADRSADQMTALVVERPGRDSLTGGDPAAVLEEADLALRQGLDRMRGSITELEQGLGAEVVHGVAGLVVADVVGNTRGAAVNGRLRFGLEALGPGEQPACGNTGVDERAVVGPAVERGRLGRQALLTEVVVEQSLDLR